MFSTLSSAKKINNANHRGYMHDKLKKENEEKKIHTILDSFKFKRLEKIKNEESFIPP